MGENEEEEWEGQGRGSSIWWGSGQAEGQLLSGF